MQYLHERRTSYDIMLMKRPRRKKKEIYYLHLLLDKSHSNITIVFDIVNPRVK